jgi:hypothetical protein
LRSSKSLITILNFFVNEIDRVDVMRHSPVGIQRDQAGRLKKILYLPARSRSLYLQDLPSALLLLLLERYLTASAKAGR